MVGGAEKVKRTFEEPSFCFSFRGRGKGVKGGRAFFWGQGRVWGLGFQGVLGFGV